MGWNQGSRDVKSIVAMVHTRDSTRTVAAFPRRRGMTSPPRDKLIGRLRRPAGTPKAQAFASIRHIYSPCGLDSKRPETSKLLSLLYTPGAVAKLP